MTTLSQDATRVGAGWRKPATTLFGVAVVAALTMSAVGQPIALWAFLGAVGHVLSVAAGCVVAGGLVLRLLGATMLQLPLRAAAWVWAVALAGRYLAGAAEDAQFTAAADGQIAGAVPVHEFTSPGWLMAAAWLASVVAVLAGRSRARPPTVWIAVPTVLALVLPTLGGHTVAASPTATAGEMLHVVAVSVWLGMLVVVGVFGRAPGALDLPWLRRMSGAALVCFAVTAGSGTVQVLLDPDLELRGVGSVASMILIGKVVLLSVLAGIGYWHRRRSLPGLAAGRPGPFWVLLAGELVLMAVAAGFGVALAHTPR